MAESPHLLVEEYDAVLVATLNRPEKYNALSNDLMARFEAAVLRFRDEPKFKVMLIRATGPYFSAGADLREPGGKRPPDTGSGIREYHRLQMRGMQRIYDEMEHIEKPFVVAHQGIVIGGGLELSLSCDFRLAAKSARYNLPEGKFGVLAASNGVSRLVRIVGTHWARYLVMTGAVVDADRALIMGLVHEVWEDDQFQSRALEFCRSLAKQNEEQVGTAKLAIEMAYDLGAAQARNVERMANSVLMLMPDYRAGFARHVAGVGRKQKG
jgi:enoyl-CoA hydratase/carnithine racemase